MTERLYYRDCFLREFDARVLKVEPAGDRFGIHLDRSAFYPTSGGQPHDVGQLGGVEIEEVLETETGEIVHLSAVPPTSETVHGVINWPRRFDHMQQHTGQHLLSAAFVRLFKYPTVSFHLGTESATIDVAAPSLAARQIRQAEELTNQVIFEDRPIRIEFGTQESLKEEAFRRPAERTGEIRIVDVEDFDRTPCGGTHVGRTGQVGLVLVRKVEKEKANIRLEFVCGGRALRVARADYAALLDAAKIFSSGVHEVPLLVQKQLDELRQRERQRSKLVERLAEYEVRDLLAQAVEIGGRRIVSKVFEEADAQYVKLVALKLVAEPNVQALLAAKVTPAPVVFAQSAGLAHDMNALLKEALARAGGKGGGSRDFAQGAAASPERVGEALTEVFAKLRA